MSFYRKDPNDSSKQIPIEKPANFYTRTSVPVQFSASKAPTYIIVREAITDGIGFFFGTPANYSASAIVEDGGTAGPLIVTGSEHYSKFGKKIAAGTYHINPIAVSGSAASVDKITYVYKGGPDGMGRS